jgi:hypothetical protein
MKWLIEQRRKNSLTREDSARLRDMLENNMVENMKGRLRDLEQGITLRVRFTNHLDEGLTLVYGPDQSTNFLVVEGPGAVDCPGFALMRTADVRRHGEGVRLEPGESREFPIKDLRYGDRDEARWLITGPGSYSVSLRFVTNHILMSNRILSFDEVTNTVDFKVEERKQ